MISTMLTTQLYSYSCVTVVLHAPRNFAFLLVERPGPADFLIIFFCYVNIIYDRTCNSGN